VVDGATTYYVYDIQYRVLEERAGDDSLAARYTYGGASTMPADDGAGRADPSTTETRWAV